MDPMRRPKLLKGADDRDGVGAGTGSSGAYAGERYCRCDGAVAARVVGALDGRPIKL